ncbi:MAG TPA: gamma-glutamyl-gamma-aminobutyrate hydrolase family protein, partial [Gemmatimonadales bacterium]|nr:gamma-glutamyl-gamma-aminobutyrate hydrolase family protein [Gemmatimonadales bacterium]
GELEPDRDAFEFAMLDAARARGLPVLAICRGMQVVNVALGGTLWQDLPTERRGSVQHDGTWARADRVHAVEIARGSTLASAVGATSIAVNSFHHQGIRALAPGLLPTATAPDGLVEGIEGADGQWLVGVQWHPEAFHAEPDSPDARLFRTFVQACALRPAGTTA